MIEVDCRRCKNLGNNECLKYGKDADIAVKRCADNGFKEYKKTSFLVNTVLTMLEVSEKDI